MRRFPGQPRYEAYEQEEDERDETGAESATDRHLSLAAAAAKLQRLKLLEARQQEAELNPGKTPEILLSPDQLILEALENELLEGTDGLPLPPGVPTRAEFWAALPESLRLQYSPEFDKVYRQMTDDERIGYEQQVALDYDELQKRYMPTVLEMYGVHKPVFKGRPVSPDKNFGYKALLRRITYLNRD